MRRLVLLCLLLAACGGSKPAPPLPEPPVPPFPALPPLGPQTINLADYTGGVGVIEEGTFWVDGNVLFRQDAYVQWHSLIDMGRFVRYAWHHMVLPQHGYIDVVVSDVYDAPTIEDAQHLTRTFWANHVGLAAIYEFGPGPSIERNCFHMGGFVRGPTLSLRINRCEMR